MVEKSSIENIVRFEFIATIPPVLRSADRTMVAQVARATYVKLLEVLEAAEFHHESDLDLAVTETGFQINFTDADFGFSLGLVENRIVLRRFGSSLNLFERWYEKLMPSIGSIVDSILRSLESELHWPQLRVLRAQSVFKIIAYGFRESSTSGQVTGILSDDDGIEPVKNSQIISRLISAVPDANGRLIVPSDVMRSLGRVDYSTSRWSETTRGSRVRELYGVEAPGNRNYSALWLTFSVIGETFDKSGRPPSAVDGVIERLPFEFDDYISEGGLDIFHELFVEKFLDGFVQELFAGYQLKTTASESLP